jgi:hypothetical protein
MKYTENKGNNQDSLHSFGHSILLPDSPSKVAHSPAKSEHRKIKGFANEKEVSLANIIKDDTDRSRIL